MREDTDELIRNACQALDAAAAVTDDSLVAPNAASLADSATYLFEKQIAYPQLAFQLRRYLGLASSHAGASGDLPACAAFHTRLAATHATDDLQHRRALMNAARAWNRAGRYADSLPLLQRVAELSQAAGDPETLHAAWIQLAPPLCESGKPGEALELQRAVIDQSGDDSVRGHAAVNGALASIVMGNSGLAVELAEMGIRWTTAAGDAGSALRGRQVLASALTERGEYGRALTALRELSVEAEKLGDLSAFGATLGNIGGVLLLMGDVHAGRLELERAYEVFLKLGDANSIANSCINLGVSLVEEGYPEQAQRHFLHAESQFDRLGDLSRRSTSRLNYAETCVLLGQLPKAERVLRDEQGCAESQELGLRCYWHAVHAELEAASGRPESARGHYAQILQAAGRQAMSGELARAAVAAAKLESSQRRWREALEFADRAIDALKGAGQVPPLLLVDALALAARAAQSLKERSIMSARLLRALELADELPLLARSEGPRAQALVAELRELEANSRI